jgi:predicted GNAT family N-acyltransferase
VEKTGKPVSQSSLQNIVDPIRKRGLIMDAYESKKSPLITLSRIEVPKEMRGSGMGTQALQDLSQYADQSAKTIALSPSKDFGASSVSRLKDFYKRFGFVENKGKNKDFSISESMYRLPTQQTRKELLESQFDETIK